MGINNLATSPVVSTMLLIGILIATVSAIMLWGVPYVEQIQMKAAKEHVIGEFTIIQNAIESMIHTGSKSSKTFDVDFEQGKVELDTFGDRLAIMYSLDKRYNFSVNGLDSNDRNFSVNLTGVSLFGCNATIYWFDGNSEVDFTTAVIPSEGNMVSHSSVIFPWTAEPNYLYRHQLVGQLSAWSDWGSKASKTYYNLPDSNYTFKLQGKCPDGHVSQFNSTNFTVVKGYTDYLDVTGISTVSDIFNFSFGGSHGTLCGAIRIDLYNASGGECFGRVFIFDLGLIEHTMPSRFGNYRSIMENNGIILVEPKRKYVKKEPPINSGENYLSLSASQLVEGDFFTYIDANSYRLSASIRQSNIREILTEAYNIKLQVCGEYAEPWNDYFNITHNFKLPSYEGGHLEHKNYENPTMLSITQHIIGC